MNSIILNLDNSSGKILYIQIYETLRDAIISGDIEPGKKLPSLRRLSEENGVSLTTAQAAYNQLLVEGYIVSRPKSGYYASDSVAEAAEGLVSEAHDEGLEAILTGDENRLYTDYADKKGGSSKVALYDEESFSFAKWKKCMNRVFNEYSNLLQTEADVQGEAALRYEISKYLFTSRGVKCTPDQVVIGAGSQAITTHLVRVLREVGIDHAATESPGYSPIKDIFHEEGFSVSGIPVSDSGILIEKLPTNLKSVVYVSPSNQFPTGAVMPIRRRYELLKWASENGSYILEDDYDSELRYFGKPVPAMKSLDTDDRVIYMGSFSATLFASIKINYMVLPDALVDVFNKIKARYSQTCSKAEQICLALYMEDGYYYRHIKKCRKMNASKLETAMKAFSGIGGIEAVDSKSGLSLMLKIRTDLPSEELCSIAKNLGLTMRAVDELSTEEVKILLFYFYRVSESLLPILSKMFVSNLNKAAGKKPVNGE